ncbi:MAG: LCP family protein [Clostridia bacterium]|nr:LCP family protein [Clostridia bacterium]
MSVTTFWRVMVRLFGAALCMAAVLLGVKMAYWYINPEEIIASAGMDTVVGGRINVLLLATDESGLLTDTMMLASCDSDRRMINLMSFPRDTRVKYGKGYQKLNAIYALGTEGSRHENTISYIRELSGLPIHYYVVVRPEGFRNIIDTLGGVWIDVPIRMYYSDPEQDLYIDLQPGFQLLDGNKAEQFTRFRSGYANADLGRIEAQQNFVKELFRQKLKPQYLMRAGEIYQQVAKDTDTNFGVSDLPVLVKILKSLKGDSIHTYEMPLCTETINGTSYVICDVEKTKELIQTVFLGQSEEPK